MCQKEYRMHYARILAEEGLKQHEIAARLGVSDRMVRKYLEPDFDSPKSKPRPSILDKFKPLIDSIIQESPQYNVMVLAERLRPQGYQGGISILRDYVAGVRAEVQTKAVLRFETEPGRQAQVDWKECGRWIIAGIEQKVYAFVMILGYSRKAFVLFTTTMTSPCLLAAHARAFAFYQGVPAEILYDNMKTAWLADGCHWRVNPALLSFAAQIGFTPQRCQVRRPQTKGKVERFIGYLGNHFLPSCKDQDLRSLDDLNNAIGPWLSKVEQETLREFCETRGERFEREQPYLRPWIAEAAGDVRQVVEVIVSREGLICYETNRYSVPAQYLGKTLVLKIDPLSNVAQLFDAAEALRQITLLPKGSRQKVVLAADSASLRARWEQEQQQAKKAANTKKPASTKVQANNPENHPQVHLTTEVATRSPEYYNRFTGERA